MDDWSSADLGSAPTRRSGAADTARTEPFATFIARLGLPNVSERLAERPILLPDRPGSLRWDSLTQAIERSILPRMVLAHRAVPEPLLHAPPPAPSPADVARMTTLVLEADLAGARGLLEALQERGMPAERLCLDLLAPVARQLGELWVEDTCSFADVTLGLGTLHQLLHTLRNAFSPQLPQRDPRRRILLAGLAGEQHTLGLQMVGAFFRRAGWEVVTEAAASEAELVGLVRGGWFAIIGISVTNDERLDMVGAAIRAVRQASRNPAVGVLVGGRAINAQPELAILLGADATAMDGEQAALRAEGLLALLNAAG